MNERDLKIYQAGFNAALEAVKKIDACEPQTAFVVEPRKLTPVAKRMNLRWTPEEDEQLKSLYPGKPAKRVGRLMGRSDKSIMQRAQVIGIARKKEAVPATLI